MLMLFDKYRTARHFKFKGMNIFKKITKVSEDSIFDKNGDVGLTPDTCYLMDAILCILSNTEIVTSISRIHLELFHCGVYISRPDLKLVIKYLEKRELVSIGINFN